MRCRGETPDPVDVETSTIPDADDVHNTAQSPVAVNTLSAAQSVVVLLRRVVSHRATPSFLEHHSRLTPFPYWDAIENAPTACATRAWVKTPTRLLTQRWPAIRCPCATWPTASTTCFSFKRESRLSPSFLSAFYDQQSGSQARPWIRKLSHHIRSYDLKLPLAFIASAPLSSLGKCRPHLLHAPGTLA